MNHTALSIEWALCAHAVLSLQEDGRSWKRIVPLLEGPSPRCRWIHAIKSSLEQPMAPRMTLRWIYVDQYQGTPSSGAAMIPSLPATPFRANPPFRLLDPMTFLIHTIAILVEQGECLLELSDLLFGQLVSHGLRFLFGIVNLLSRADRIFFVV